MILAAAIKFRIMKTGSEVVLCGVRHNDIFGQLERLGFEPNADYKQLEQGFIDQNGDFLSREEAYEEAALSGQLCSKLIKEKENGTVFGRRLTTEDLW